MTCTRSRCQRIESHFSFLCCIVVICQEELSICCSDSVFFKRQINAVGFSDIDGGTEMTTLFNVHVNC